MAEGMQDQIMDAVGQKHVQLNSDASSLNMEALPNGKANETRESKKDVDMEDTKSQQKMESIEKIPKDNDIEMVDCDGLETRVDCKEFKSENGKVGTSKEPEIRPPDQDSDMKEVVDVAPENPLKLQNGLSDKIKDTSESSVSENSSNRTHEKTPNETPEEFNETSENSNKTPENSNGTPENSNETSKNLNETSEDSRKTSENSKPIPETFSEMSENSKETHENPKETHENSKETHNNPNRAKEMTSDDTKLAESDSTELKNSTCSENLKQENLLKKLGFQAMNKISLENLCKENFSSVDEVSKKSSSVDKVIKDMKERLLEETNSNKSNNSSRCSSPGVYMNGIYSDKDGSRKEKVAEQKLLIATLKEDLRNEEAQLLLLRKIMESQSAKRTGPMLLHKSKENSSRHVNMPSLHPKSRLPGQGYSAGQPDGISSSIQIAPKIVVGSKSSSVGPNLPRVVPSIVSAGKSASGSVASSSIDASRVTYAQLHGSVPATAVMTQPGHRYYIQVGSQLVPAAPPSCTNQPLYAIPTYSNASSSTTKPKVTIASSGSMPSSKPAQQSMNSLETQASKHSAAKAALRRQLEQTLLQIPPPKPPAADWRVIPNVNSMDFMMLVGLDEIVDMILECDGKPTLKRILSDMLPDNPIICDQCGMDFSPLWKNRGSEKMSGVLCEKCSLANTKKDLKAEHTSRLKSAFLKALKQEQEIEEKIKAGEDVYIASPPLQDKDAATSVITHHKSQGHLHSVHQSFKHQKNQKSADHHHQSVHHHHHGVVQHYPHHTSLVHQLHQQHIQQQQVDYDPGTSSSRRNARWHPYAGSHHHGSNHHGVPHHRTYSGSNSSSRSDARHEYYVVHHPQHSTSAPRWGH